MHREDPMIEASAVGVEGYDLELDEFVAAFERRRIADSSVSLGEFLPPPHHPRRSEVLLELIRVDMELAWDSGVERFLEDYAIDYPGLFRDAKIVRQLAHEEIRLRRAAGESPSISEFAQRFECLAQDAPSANLPPAKSPLVSLPKPAEAPPTRMPQPGEVVRDFELTSELGAGSFARVFLAKQLDLAERPVVIKVSSRFPGEAGTLARLQHTHIVPVYSVHQHGRFHLVCMPFLGACTFADLLTEIRNESAPLSGKAVASTLHNRLSRTWRTADSKESLQEKSVQSGNASARKKQSPDTLLARLETLSYQGFVLAVAADLADALSHAHERGILHRDIKPANILLTDDGQAMLLDFNLASDRNDAQASNESIGGTLRYMSPEALRRVFDSTVEVDQRSDLYSLGVVLLELLTRSTPFTDRTGDWKTVTQQMIDDREKLPMQAIWRSKELTPAIRSILKKLLDAKPEGRYRTAAELREDLQRQITHRPLRYAPDRSLSERAHKWVLRHPRLSSAGSVSLVAAGLLLCLLTAFFVRQSYVRKLENQQRIAQVQHKLVAARGLLSGRDESPAEIDAGLQQCDDALKLLKLSSDDSEEVRQIQAELLLQKSRGLFSAAMRQTSLAKKSEFLTAARKTNDQTVSFAQEGSLHLRWLAQRVEILARSEKPYESELAQLKSLSGAKADSAGTAYAQAALDSLRGEVDVKAADADYWLARGKLEALLNRLPEAQSSLRLAMELAPNSPWPVYHAALLNLENANYSKAKSLLDRAIELAPQNTDAYFNRALVRLKTGDAANAIADLDKVGPTLEEFPRAYFVRELAKRGLGEGASAAADLQKGLSLTPTDALSWNARGEARLRATVSDPKGALSDFSQAIALDPYLREAYENKAHVLSEVEGKIDLAIDTLTEAVQKFPDYTLARSSLAVLLARAGKREEARTEAELALTKDRSAIICYQVACVYLLTYQNETDEARAISLLKETVRKEPQLADLMPTDQDLLRVRNGTDLRALLEAINRLR